VYLFLDEITPTLIELRAPLGRHGEPKNLVFDPLVPRQTDTSLSDGAVIF
jgi:hypothetical protein